MPGGHGSPRKRAVGHDFFCNLEVISTPRPQPSFKNGYLQKHNTLLNLEMQKPGRNATFIYFLFNTSTSRSWLSPRCRKGCSWPWKSKVSPSASTANKIRTWSCQPGTPVNTDVFSAFQNRSSFKRWRSQPPKKLPEMAVCPMKITFQVETTWFLHFLSSLPLSWAHNDKSPKDLLAEAHCAGSRLSWSPRFVAVFTGLVTRGSGEKGIQRHQNKRVFLNSSCHTKQRNTSNWRVFDQVKPATPILSLLKKHQQLTHLKFL